MSSYLPVLAETTIKLLFVPVWVTFPKSSHRGNAAFNEHISIRGNYPASSSRKTSQHTKHSAVHTVQLPKQSIAPSVTPQHKQGAIFYMSHGLQGLLLATKRSVSTSSGLLHQRSRYLKCNSFTQAFCWLHLPWLLLFGALVLFLFGKYPHLLHTGSGCRFWYLQTKFFPRKPTQEFCSGAYQLCRTPQDVLGRQVPYLTLSSSAFFSSASRCSTFIIASCSSSVRKLRSIILVGVGRVKPPERS